jgi:hypothetical protein
VNVGAATAHTGKWMDGELGECTVIRRTSYQGQRALWCTYYEDNEVDVRERMQQFGC